MSQQIEFREGDTVSYLESQRTGERTFAVVREVGVNILKVTPLNKGYNDAFRTTIVRSEAKLEAPVEPEPEAEPAAQLEPEPVAEVEAPMAPEPVAEEKSRPRPRRRRGQPESVEPEAPTEPVEEAPEAATVEPSDFQRSESDEGYVDAFADPPVPEDEHGNISLFPGMAVEVVTPLTEQENAERERLEGIIATGLQSFLEVGLALVEIRDNRYYRDTHRTFDDYCRDRWGISKTHANRTISAAEVVRELAPTGATLPANESQARPLTRLPEPEQRQEAWQRAQELAADAGTNVTAAHVEAAAQEVQPKSPVTPPALEPELVQEETPEPEPAPEPVAEPVQKPAATPVKTTLEKAKERASEPAAEPAPAPTVAPAPAPAPAPAANGKLPAGMIMAPVPQDDVFFLEDHGLSMAEAFRLVRQLVEIGEPVGLGPDDLLTTLRGVVGEPAEAEVSNA